MRVQFQGMSIHTPLPRSAPVPLPVCAHVAITLRLEDASSDVFVRHVRLLRNCVALAQQRWGFEIDAAVVLPSEVQLLCAFEDAEFGVGGAVKLIRTAFERHTPDSVQVCWAEDGEVLEISAPVAELRKAFIEEAPVRAGLVSSAADWPYSSAHAQSVQSTRMGVAVA